MESKRNKQEVNELARVIYSMFRSDSMSRALASVLHNDGYRKASVVAREIIGEILRYADTHQAFLEEIPMAEVVRFGEFLGELEKKYTEGTK